MRPRSSRAPCSDPRGPASASSGALGSTWPARSSTASSSAASATQRLSTSGRTPTGRRIALRVAL
eukprot:12841619-Alexandrium_andersonii.AAC.1